LPSISAVECHLVADDEAAHLDTPPSQQVKPPCQADAAGKRWPFVVALRKLLLRIAVPDIKLTEDSPLLQLPLTASLNTPLRGNEIMVNYASWILNHQWRAA
jgi:hypothetical protein